VPATYCLELIKEQNINIRRLPAQNFKFKNRLFVTAAARIDGSSVFGEDQRNQLYLKFSEAMY
jgi:hypothetical protein